MPRSQCWFHASWVTQLTFHHSHHHSDHDRCDHDHHFDLSFHRKYQDSRHKGSRDGTISMLVVGTMLSMITIMITTTMMTMLMKMKMFMMMLMKRMMMMMMAIGLNGRCCQFHD